VSEHHHAHTLTNFAFIKRVCLSEIFLRHLRKVQREVQMKHWDIANPLLKW
jgi:hypothetical protein